MGQIQQSRLQNSLLLEVALSTSPSCTQQQLFGQTTFLIAQEKIEKWLLQKSCWFVVCAPYAAVHFEGPKPWTDISYRDSTLRMRWPACLLITDSWSGREGWKRKGQNILQFGTVNLPVAHYHGSSVHFSLHCRCLQMASVLLMSCQTSSTETEILISFCYEYIVFLKILAIISLLACWCLYFY